MTSEEALEQTLKRLRKRLNSPERGDYEEALRIYVRDTLARTRSVRTLVNRHVPLPLEDLYVPTRIQVGTRPIRDNVLIAEMLGSSRRGQLLVVQGTAGSGKTMFMRKMLSDALQMRTIDRVPLYIELRALDWAKYFARKDALADQFCFINDFVELAYRHIAFHAPLRRRDFDLLLSKGGFLFLLDGLDELPQDARAYVLRGIRWLGRQSAESCTLVSTRPDPIFAPLFETELGRMMPPFDESQVIELVNRLPIDETVKRNFIEAKKRGDFRQQSDFLSVPLLATIVLMTYDENARVPGKQHIFYEQAYSALFFRHDALKADDRLTFHRERNTNLEADEFADIFSVFSALTYSMHRFVFTRPELSAFVRNSAEVLAIPLDVAGYITDLHEAVCLLQWEGIDSQYAHRSFQEYFTARYVLSCPEQEAAEFLDSVSARGVTDRVFKLLFEMDRAFLERAWAKAKVQEILSQIAAWQASTGTTALESFTRGTIILDQAGLSLTLTPNWSRICNASDLRLLCSLYEDVCDTQWHLRVSEETETALRDGRLVAMVRSSGEEQRKTAPLKLESRNRGQTFELDLASSETREFLCSLPEFLASKSAIAEPLQRIANEIDHSLERRRTGFRGIMSARKRK